MSTLYNHRPHAFQLTGHDTPVLSPVRVSLELVPFDQSPSLHPLRGGWLSRLVRRLRGYYDSVRLPMFVHRQITSLDLLTRSARHLADKHRLSRFSRRLFLYMLRFFDRAGFGSPSRFRDLRYGLPLPPTVSAPWSKVFRGSMAGLYMPLSTLQGWPHGQPHMTQGRYGSLNLYRMSLSFTTTCRFSPALSGGCQ